MSDDMTLVREFTALMERHIALVHSAALRQAGDAHLIMVWQRAFSFRL